MADYLENYNFAAIFSMQNFLKTCILLEQEVVLGMGVKDLRKRVKKSRSINVKVRAPFKDSLLINSRNRKHEEYICS